MLDEIASERPPSGIIAREVALADGHLLFDDSLIARPDSPFFEPSHWRAQQAVIAEPAGRSPVCVFRDQGLELVLRHYCRGGLAARLSRDRYWWRGLEKSRPWQEWHLLADLHQSGLPVPRPVAARVRRHGLFYSADLVTIYLSGTRTLADRLRQAALEVSMWRIIGATIHRFHTEGVCHADLNAHNVLIDDQGRVYLIDFDRGRRGEADPRSRLDNLERLQRSLHKLHAQLDRFHFTGDDWLALLAGYRGAD